MATHGVGADVGNSIAPLAIGLILTVLTWRQLLQVNVIPALLLGLLVFWGLSGLRGEGSTRADLRMRIQAARRLIRNTRLLGIVGIAGCRSAAHVALLTFLTIYFKENLEMSAPAIGFHVSLLTLLGIVASPFMGMASDRVGRKAVLIFGLSAIGVLALALLWAGGGFKLTIVVAFLGLLLHPLSAVIQAATMDVVGRGVEATAIGVVLTGSHFFSGISPVVAGVLVTATGATETAFYYVGALGILAALLAAVLPIQPAPAARSERAGA